MARDAAAIARRPGNGKLARMRNICLLVLLLVTSPAPARAQVINGETSLDDTVIERETPESEAAAKARAAAATRADTSRPQMHVPGEPVDGRRN